ncbi:MAG: acyl-CoA dehydrogenase, partial [Limnohabitans sp.]
ASVAAAAYDAAHHHPDAQTRKQNLAAYEFMVPLVKGFSTEMSLEVTSLGVQVHGGMGFIEETGAAQYYRDAKILTIYEGTTAIQANDLVGRKTVRDGGQTPKALAAQMQNTETELLALGTPDAKAIALRLSAARDALLDVVNFMVDKANSDPNGAYAGSVPYLMLAGNVIAGWQLARSHVAAHQALANGDTDTAFLQAKQVTARFYADHILSKAPAARDSIVQGAQSVTAMALEAF